MLETNNVNIDNETDAVKQALLYEENKRQRALSEESLSKSKNNSEKDFEYAETDHSVLPNEMINQILFFLIKGCWQQINKSRSINNEDFLFWQKIIADTRRVNHIWNKYTLEHLKKYV